MSISGISCRQHGERLFQHYLTHVFLLLQLFPYCGTEICVLHLLPGPVSQPHTRPAALQAWSGRFLWSLLAQWLPKHVGNCVLSRRAGHVRQVRMCSSALWLPVRVENAWAEFSSRQAVVKDLFSVCVSQTDLWHVAGTWCCFRTLQGKKKQQW